MAGVYPDFEEFKRAITINSFPLPNNVETNYKAFQSAGKFVRDKFPSSFITSKREMAMFFAQCLHESGGLQVINKTGNFSGNLTLLKKIIKYKEEIGRPSGYTGGAKFYGRGYIQLTHDYNYSECSKDLYGDDRLERNPDQVSNSDEESWRTAFWFWAKRVHTVAQNNDFDATTDKINSIEGQQGRANRKAIFDRVFKAFGIN